MSTIQEIEQAIEKLPREELFRLTDWLSSRFSEQWDQQIEEDVAAGLWDDLAAETVAEHRAGGSMPMPSDEKEGEFEVLESLQEPVSRCSTARGQAIPVVDTRQHASITSV